MANEIKKTTDEIMQNTADTQEGAIPDDAAETAAGGGSLFGGVVAPSLTKLKDKPVLKQLSGNTKDR